LVGGAASLAKALQYAVGNHPDVPGYQKLAINGGNTHWCGHGGNGVPVNSNDWACLAHDFNYYDNKLTFGDNYNIKLLFSKGPLLEQINQTLCNNVDASYEGVAIISFFRNAVGYSCE
jgi:hypothetical protein